MTLLCMGRCLPASPRDFITCCPAGAGVQLWTTSIKRSFAGVSPGRCMLQLHSPPGASSPLRPPQASSYGDFPFHRRGGPALPAEDAAQPLWCCCSCRASYWRPSCPPPWAGKLPRAGPWPSETILSDCAQGLGMLAGVAGYNWAIPATFAAAHISQQTSAILTFKWPWGCVLRKC